EVALLAGKPLINLVGDQVPEAPPLALDDGEALGGELAAGIDVPQPELADHAAVGAAAGPAQHEGLGIDHAPVLETRLGIEIAGGIDEGGAVEGLEQAGALQIGGDDVGNLA